jgi:hypothetical protein
LFHTDVALFSPLLYHLVSQVRALLATSALESSTRLNMIRKMIFLGPFLCTGCFLIILSVSTWFSVGWSVFLEAVAFTQLLTAFCALTLYVGFTTVHTATKSFSECEFAFWSPTKAVAVITVPATLTLWSKLLFLFISIATKTSFVFLFVCSNVM